MAENKKLWKCGLNKKGSSVQFSLFSASTTDLNTELRAGCALYYDLADNSDERAGGVGSDIGRRKGQSSGQGKGGSRLIAALCPSWDEEVEWMSAGGGRGRIW